MIILLAGLGLSALWFAPNVVAGSATPGASTPGVNGEVRAWGVLGLVRATSFVAVAGSAALALQTLWGLRLHLQRNRCLRCKSLSVAQNRVLERITTDASLEEALTCLAEEIESQTDGMLCSILLLEPDGRRVRHGAAPNLPEDYVKAIDGLSIGPKTGSCGTAMYRKEPVIVGDILNDPLWEDYRELASAYGLRACWSTPIIAASGKVLGSFAMYYREPRLPGREERRLCEVGASLARIAIERKNAQQALRESQQRLWLIFNNASDMMALFAVDANGEPKLVSCNRRYLEVMKGAGLEVAETQLVGRSIRELMTEVLRFEAADVARTMSRFQQAITTCQPVRYQETYDLPNGRYYGQSVLSPLRNAEGRCEHVLFCSDDITDIKRTKLALAEEATRRRTLFERSKDGIVVLDLGGRVREANPSFCQMLGYTDEEIKQLHIWDWDARWRRAEFPAVLADLAHRSTTFETRHRRKGGTLCDVEVSVSGAQVGAQVLLYCIHRDVTERNRSRAELERQNRELSLLNAVIGAPDGDTDPSALLGLACRELGKNFNLSWAAAWTLNPEQSALLLQAEFGGAPRPAAARAPVLLADTPALRTALEGREPEVVEDARSSSAWAPLLGRMRDSELRSLLKLPLLIEHGVEGWLLLAAGQDGGFSGPDIELARKVANHVGRSLTLARLNQTRKRLMTAIEQTPESIVITDLAGRMQYANPSFVRTSGYALPEVLGRNLRLLKSGRHEPGFYEELWTKISSGQVWRGRFINKRKNGQFFTEEATIAPVRDERGAMANYVAVKRDVTHELKLEEQLRQAHQREAIGQLAGGVAHEFNNILSAMLLQVGMMQEQAQLPAETRQRLRELESGAERAAQLTRQLLLFSSRQPMRAAPLNLDELAQKLLEMLGRVLGERVTIEFEASQPACWVRGDSGLLEQVVTDLALNARDAMPEGGRLKVGISQVEIDEAGARANPEARAGTFACLVVADTGRGMDEATRRRIFEPFFTTKEFGRGSGLGLATVYGIVQQHQGWIEVDSTPGRGTQFRILLPSLPAPASAPQSATPAPASLEGSETILLVEDDESVRHLIALVLRLKGYRVLESANASEALAQWAQCQAEIDLLFSDVVMPGDLTGLQLAARLRRERPGLKVILSSGYSAELAGGGAPLPADVLFLPKPCPQEILLQTVRRCLDRAESP